MKATGGKVTVDGKDLPISDNNAMRHRRMTEVSLVPQYAMSALTPTRKIGKMINDLLKSHHVKDRQAVLHRAEAPPGADRPQGGRAQQVLLRTVRRHAAAGDDHHVLAAEPVVARRRRGDVRARRVHPARGGRDADRVPRPRLHQVGHRDHPRPVDPGADRRLDRDHVRGPAGGAGADVGDRGQPAAPLHPGAARLAARGRGAARPGDADRHTGPPAFAGEPAGRVPLQGPLPVRVREVHARPRRSRRSSRATWSRAGRSARSRPRRPGPDTGCP